MALLHNMSEAIWRGDTVEIPFTLSDALGAISLEGATVRFTLKLDPTAADADADYIYEAAVPDPDADGAAGTHTVRIERAASAAFQLASYTYQFKVIYPNPPNDDEITYLYGKVSVKDS